MIATFRLQASCPCRRTVLPARILRQARRLPSFMTDCTAFRFPLTCLRSSQLPRERIAHPLVPAHLPPQPEHSIVAHPCRVNLHLERSPCCEPEEGIPDGDRDPLPRPGRYPRATRYPGLLHCPAPRCSLVASWSEGASHCQSALRTNHLFVIHAELRALLTTITVHRRTGLVLILTYVMALLDTKCSSTNRGFLTHVIFSPFIT